MPNGVVASLWNCIQMLKTLTKYLALLGSKYSQKFNKIDSFLTEILSGSCMSEEVGLKY